MPLGIYRINRATIALFEENGRHVSRTVPGGAVIEINSAALDGDKLVDVIWDGKRVMMFTQDLRTRGTLVDGKKLD
jgi:hypothetical protein